MKNIVIIGGGTGGTATANALVQALDSQDYRVTVIEPSARHYYNPGFVQLTIGKVPNPVLWRWRRRTFRPGVRLLQDRVTKVNPVTKTIETPNRRLNYDYLVIATGCQCRPDIIEGMAKGNWLADGIYSFYTLRGAKLLRRALQRFEKGTLVVHISEFPIRCPVAPVEFALLANQFFFQHRRRDDIDIKVVTPQSDIFEQPIAARELSDMLRFRNIEVKPDFVVRHIDAEEKRMYSYDGTIVDYDMLVTVPPMRGQQFIVDSGLGDEMGYIHPDLETLQHKVYPDIFVIGDVADLPTSKAGSAAIYQSRVLVTNLIDYMEGKQLAHRYDGHATCIIDTGFHKATVIDRNYSIPAVTGKLFIPHLGPLSLLKNTRLNYLVKRFMFPFYSVLLMALPFLKVNKLQLAGKEFAKWGLRSDGTTYVSSAEQTTRTNSFIAPTWKRRPNACLAASFKVKTLKLPVLEEAGGVRIDTDAEGFLRKPEQWTRAVGEDLAKAVHFEMTDRHWQVIDFARRSYFEYDTSPTLRRYELSGGFPITELFDLFPFKPNKIIAYIAGIPKPVGCV